MKWETNGTMVAVSTPLGEGGIGIVRMSGSQAIAIARRIFRPREEKEIGEARTHTLHYGHIIRKGEVIDEVLLTVMRAPGTYTREDIVEINCHGGIQALRQVLELVVAAGARLAGPGEFTRRAFLNGRIDLAQAEAVADIISARTRLSLRSALSQLKGELSRVVEEVRARLRPLLVELEASIDFPEDEITVRSRDSLAGTVEEAVGKLERLLGTWEEGKVLREGVRAAIVGRANVGKSSLLNHLLGTDRAIVSDIPGTTRDVIEEVADIEGIPVGIADTAGFRRPRDTVEKEGVRRAQEAVRNADLAVLVLNGSEPLREDDRRIAREVEGIKTVVVINRSTSRRTCQIATHGKSPREWYRCGPRPWTGKASGI